MGRVYCDHATRAAYKRIWEEIQNIVVKLTGRRFGPKVLMPDGKLLSIGCDMEIAQALGCGDAFLPLNDPAHSGVVTDDPKILIQYFIKICLTHFKRYALHCSQLAE